MATFTDRLIGAARLDVDIYEEVEADSNALGQAMTVVVLSSLAAGLPALRSGVLPLVGLTLTALVGWAVWAGLTYVIGTRLLPEPGTRADVGELLRTTGFAQAPGLLRILGFIPLIGWLISLLITIWMLAAMVIAVRQALDYQSTRRAVGVCLIGFVVYVVIMAVVGMFFGLAAAVGGS